MSIGSARKILVTLAVASFLSTAAVLAQESAGDSFEGNVVLESVGDDPFVPAFRLGQTLVFRQANGEEWISPSGAIVDGRSVPGVFVQLKGHPFEGNFRKSAVTYDYAVKIKQREWETTLRMFYDALRVEGIVEADAKSMYMILSGAGTRWAMRGPNSCFSRCHVDSKELEWRPRVDGDKLLSLVEWVEAENPDLDQIDERARATIVEAGPHIFGAKR